MIQEKKDSLREVRNHIEKLEWENTILKRLAYAVNDYFRLPLESDLQEVITEMKNTLDTYQKIPHRSPEKSRPENNKLRLLKFPKENDKMQPQMDANKR